MSSSALASASKHQSVKQSEDLMKSFHPAVLEFNFPSHCHLFLLAIHVKHWISSNLSKLLFYAFFSRHKISCFMWSFAVLMLHGDYKKFSIVFLFIQWHSPVKIDAMKWEVGWQGGWESSSVERWNSIRRFSVSKWTSTLNLTNKRKTTKSPQYVLLLFCVPFA